MKNFVIAIGAAVAVAAAPAGAQEFRIGFVNTMTGGGPCSASIRSTASS